jgi:hypothetical protein
MFGFGKSNQLDKVEIALEQQTSNFNQLQSGVHQSLERQTVNIDRFIAAVDKFSAGVQAATAALRRASFANYSDPK